MPAPFGATNEIAPLSSAEQEALATVRDRFQLDRDRFSDRELVRLQFLRWLVQTGHLES